MPCPLWDIVVLSLTCGCMAGNLGCAPTQQNAPTIDDVMEAFSTFDTNGNGYIPLPELKHLMGTLGEGLSAENLEKMAAACEPDSDNQVRRVTALLGPRRASQAHGVPLMLLQCVCSCVCVCWCWCRLGFCLVHSV